MAEVEDHRRKRREEFEIELSKLVNRFSLEGGSDTPDFIVAESMALAMDVVHRAIQERDEWYGIALQPGKGSAPPDIEGDMLRKLVAWKAKNDGERIWQLRDNLAVTSIEMWDYAAGHDEDGPIRIFGITIPALAAKLDEWLAGQSSTDCGRLERRE